MSGGKVILPGGTYSITDNLAIAKSLTFEGNGPATVVKYQDGAIIPANKPLISVKPSGASFTDVVISGLTVDGNSGATAQAGQWNAGIEVSTDDPQNVGNVWIYRTHVKNVAGDCVTVRGSAGYTVIPYDVFISHNLFEAWHANRQGVAIIDGRRVSIRSNHFFNYAGGFWAVDIEPNNNVGEVVDQVEISGNILDVPRGITVADQPYVADGAVLIFGNIDNTTIAYASIPNLAKVASFRIASGIQESMDYFGIANSIEVANAYGSHGRIETRSTRVTVPLLGASVAFNPMQPGGIPAGAMMLGVQFNVDAVIAGCVSWSAAFSQGSATSLGSGYALALDTKVDKLIVPEILTDWAEITVTAVGGGATFTGGTLEVVSYYMLMQPLGNV